MTDTPKIQIPVQHWDTIMDALWSMENHDNTMSGEPTKRALATHDWFNANCEWSD